MEPLTSQFRSNLGTYSRRRPYVLQRMWSGNGAGAGFLSQVRPAVGASGSSRSRPSVPARELRGKIRLLSIVWFIYGGVSLVLGLAGLTFAKAFFSGGMAPGCTVPG